MLSILSLNLRFGLAQDGPDGWALRKNSLSDLLTQYPSDFAGFQEANDFQIDYLDAELPGYSYIGKRSPAPSFWQNNVIFYHASWECVHQDHFFLSPTPDIPSRFRDSMWPRQCTVGMLQKKDATVICINTHLDFAPTVQADSARIILERIRPLPQETPVILFGDFNAVPDSASHQVFTGKSPDRPPDARVFKEVFQSPYPATFHGFTGKIDGDHIDWILYSGPLSPLSHAVLHQKFGGRYPSDHFPILAKFEIGA